MARTRNTKKKKQPTPTPTPRLVQDPTHARRQLAISGLGLTKMHISHLKAEDLQAVEKDAITILGYIAVLKKQVEASQ